MVRNLFRVSCTLDANKCMRHSLKWSRVCASCIHGTYCLGYLALESHNHTNLSMTIMTHCRCTHHNQCLARGRNTQHRSQTQTSPAATNTLVTEPVDCTLCAKCLALALHRPPTIKFFTGCTTLVLVRRLADCTRRNRKVTWVIGEMQ